MKKWLQRILIFFLGIPAIVAIVMLLPWYNHLVFNLLVTLFSSIGAMELSVLLRQKNIVISKAEAAILGALPPLAMILIISFNVRTLILPVIIVVSASWLLVSRILSKGNSLDTFVNRFAAGSVVLLYPGILLTWLIRMSKWGEISGIIILIFISAVFFNDGLAWAAGILFGKGNQGLIPASPNKSIAGFIGGAFASIVVGTASALLWPAIFEPQFKCSVLEIPAVAGAILGLFTGIAATLGDLGESALKRSAGRKDSGNLIPGRGGVLDSIDSIILAAPVFYIFYSLLFKQP